MAEEIRDMVIERGNEEGWITPASRTSLGLAKRFSAPRTIADVLDGDRGTADPDATLSGDS